ncbi:hypothetical protein LXL04_011229 [Taraxacum kok-saghyz]
MREELYRRRSPSSPVDEAGVQMPKKKPEADRWRTEDAGNFFTEEGSSDLKTSKISSNRYNNKKQRLTFTEEQTRRSADPGNFFTEPVDEAAILGRQKQKLELQRRAKPKKKPEAGRWRSEDARNFFIEEGSLSSNRFSIAAERGMEVWKEVNKLVDQEIIYRKRKKKPPPIDDHV